MDDQQQQSYDEVTDFPEHDVESADVEAAGQLEEAEKSGCLTDAKIEDILIEAGIITSNSRFGPLNPKACNICGATNRPLRLFKKKTVNPNAFICDKCWNKWIEFEGMAVDAMAAEFDRLLTLDPVRRNRCGCGRVIEASAKNGYPALWCRVCEEERRRLEATSKRKPPANTLPGKG